MQQIFVVQGVVRTEFQNNTRHKENSAWVELVRTLKESDTGINEDEDFDDGQDHFHDDHNHFADDGFFCASGPGKEVFQSFHLANNVL